MMHANPQVRKIASVKNSVPRLRRLIRGDARLDVDELLERGARCGVEVAARNKHFQIRAREIL